MDSWTDEDKMTVTKYVAGLFINEVRTEVKDSYNKKTDQAGDNRGGGLMWRLDGLEHRLMDQRLNRC